MSELYLFGGLVKLFLLGLSFVFPLFASADVRVYINQLGCEAKMEDRVTHMDSYGISATSYPTYVLKLYNENSQLLSFYKFYAISEPDSKSRCLKLNLAKEEWNGSQVSLNLDWLQANQDKILDVPDEAFMKIIRPPRKSK